MFQAFCKLGDQFSCVIKLFRHFSRLVSNASVCWLFSILVHFQQYFCSDIIHCIKIILWISQNICNLLHQAKGRLGSTYLIT